MRDLVERCVGQLGHWRAVATRYEKRAADSRAVIAVAALLRWRIDWGGLMERRCCPTRHGAVRPPRADVIDMRMDEIDALSALLARRYGAHSVALHPLVRDEEKRLYRVERAGLPSWLLRAAPPQANPAAFHEDAALLGCLEGHAYPAPRVVPALDGATVTECMGHPVIVTTFIAGEPTDFSPASLNLLGSALGRLHALPLPEVGRATAGEPRGIPSARMVPRPELAAARAWLAEVRDVLPDAHRARYEQLAAACHALDLPEDLPIALIHNDCHPGNSVRASDGQVVLIDWEGAGRGPMVADIGFLLVSCEIEAFRPNRLPPDPDRVVAVVDGYCRHHRLSRRELDRLPDAIRFRSVVACAGGLWRMVREGRAHDGADWAWARLAATDEIAARTRERFERYTWPR